MELHLLDTGKFQGGGDISRWDAMASESKKCGEDRGIVMDDKKAHD